LPLPEDMEGLGGVTRPFGIMLLNYFNSGNNDFYDGLGEVRGPRLEPNATTVLP